MSEFISLRGVRHHNLKNLDIDLPMGKLTVVTGVSGSGKSTLAFDVLYAEGQRRYIETFSPYARQFFDRMDKPQADRIENILPAIAIEQNNSVKTSRSTVGTMTEICDYLKVLWPHISNPYCPKCAERIIATHPHQIWEQFHQAAPHISTALITFKVPLSAKISFSETLSFVQALGYRRVLLDNQVLPLEKIPIDSSLEELEIVQDRIVCNDKAPKRFTDSSEQAYKYGRGLLAIRDAEHLEEPAYFYTNKLECSRCHTHLPKPVAGLFSYNHPLGACPVCHGFGRNIGIDMNLVIPDPNKTLLEGAIRPWQTGFSQESQQDLVRLAPKHQIPLDIPFKKLSAEQKRWVIEGDPDYGTDKKHEWPHFWYGIKGYFKWLETHVYKLHIRVFLSRYRIYRECEACGGTRFVPETLCFKVTHPLHKESEPLTLPQFYDLELCDALAFIKAIKQKNTLSRPIQYALAEVENRLSFLNEIGLGYLTLNRQTRQLSGGETERVSLTCCLGNRLVNTLYILDEPSVGLHPRDTEKLVEIVKKLRDIGNTVVTVEHEPLVIQAADHIIDLGPQAGTRGGEIVFQGPYKKFTASKTSRTAGYITGRLQISPDPALPLQPKALLKIRKATANNLQELDVDIPLQRFVCITGVSGSGKSTLLKNIVYPGVTRVLNSTRPEQGFQENGENPAKVASIAFPKSLISNIFLVDQSPIVKTPRSCPAMYVGAFDELRQFFVWKLKSENKTSFQPGLFTFNSKRGQCPRCKGLGFEEIQMQFLSNVFTRCPDCNGTRFNPQALMATIDLPSAEAPEQTRPLNIANFLELSVDDALKVLAPYEENRYALRASAKLKVIQQTGLGYISLGQPLNTLSGGECQRLKLASYIAESLTDKSKEKNHFVFLFDEPSTGLHFDDIDVLLKFFKTLVKEGHSVLVIEHNLDIIKCANWVIDMGPEAGREGGKIIAQGPPQEIAAHPTSYTGQFLKKYACPQHS